jgi:hypothetical protein
MATVASNIITYAVTLFVLGFEDDKTITKEDLYVFTVSLCIEKNKYFCQV